ncbi:MAG: DNA replication/repair protein RecF [Gammaproteobacteria bacterium]
MSLIRLDVADFRNLSAVKIDPIESGFNVFYGDNGSGKTSLLEAIYYLSRGRSFRSTSTSHVINHTAKKLSLFAHIQTASPNPPIPIGIERQRNGDMKIRIAGEDGASFAELVQLMPALLINSNCYNLLDGGPIFRRKYLDWGAFYLTNDFFRIWKQYERALKQRNAALRVQSPKKELQIWTLELVRSASALHELRRDFVQQLLPFLNSALLELISIPGLKMGYQPGWDDSLNFQEEIERSIDKDRYVGYTQLGPHRADFKITINQTPVKDILSRGQQKLFVCAMIVAQGAMLQQCVNRRPIYLIDDLPSELDSLSRTNLMALLSRQEAQVFLTAVEREALADSFARVPVKMFHVEHGETREVN